MSLHNMPYLPMFAGDWLSNNNLKMCSAVAHGVMINTMLIMHKSEEYGVVLLKQKFKQTSKQENNFALQLAKLLPLDLLEIEKGLFELIEENVLIIEGDKLICSRMVRDNEISITRSKAGSKGGKKTQEKKRKESNKFASDFDKAKVQANTEDEIEYENIINNTNKKEIKFDLPENLKDGEFEEKFKEWIDYKKENKFTYKSIGLKNLISKLSNDVIEKGIDVVKDAITDSMAQGYKGIIIRENNFNNFSKTPTTPKFSTEMLPRGGF